ncbi:helix-turn-helix transcriptional regulator [Kitasatospora sp. NPDC058965]|uniref:helix-turn-helix domain-containing protein n=1 Tax=Kitasatospora sp. NPDC058965 TaxID=3346682 RepID=UPI0036B1AE4F
MNQKKLDPQSGPYAPFGIQLRKLRNEKAWTQSELGRRMGYSDTHVSAVETALKSPKLDFAKAADRGLESGNLLELMWWSAQHANVLEGFAELMNLEAQAISMRVFELNIVPSLFQTPAYMRAYQDAPVRRGTVPKELADERMEIRLARQRRLNRDPAPTIHAVLDEACLRRPIGDVPTMIGQLRYLEELCERPGFTIQVAPFELGESRPFAHPVTLLTLPGRSMVAYGETQRRGYLERDAEAVSEILRDYDHLQVEALSRAASLRFIRKVREDFERHAQ